MAALRVGVRGYALETQTGADVIGGPAGLARDDVAESLGERPEALSARLIQREPEVLQLVAEGETTKEIAQGPGVGVRRRIRTGLSATPSAKA